MACTFLQRGAAFPVFGLEPLKVAVLKLRNYGVCQERNHTVNLSIDPAGLIQNRNVLPQDERIRQDVQAVAVAVRR